ncbi:MAG: hypothetical protein IPF63_03665 [Bacteroidetes bacterium]|nr:hypothetical protein [Bacteroidota bacterium]
MFFLQVILILVAVLKRRRWWHTYLLKATWSNDGKLTNGTWGVAPSNLDGGTFSMNRTN